MSALLPVAAADALAGPGMQALQARWWRRGLVGIALWLALFVAWSALAPISGAVLAAGRVTVAASRQTVSHRDGGLVAQVLVREGQSVAQGQPLLLLEDARVDASVEQLRAQLVSERLRRSRLEAEAAQRDRWAPPADILAAGAPASAAEAPSASPRRNTEAVQRERSAFEARQRALAGQVEAIRQQIRDTALEIRAHQRNAVAAAEAIRLLREEIASNQQLLRENFVNRARVLGLQRNLADYESRVETTEAEHAKARQRQAELEGRLASLHLAHVQTATEELREVAGRIVDIEERLRAGRDAADRQVVTAPTAGRLVDLRVDTAGAALGPREPIVDIVPAGQPLTVETQVAADAIGEVQAGQPAEVRLLGTGQRSQDLLQGRVRRVSADALVDARSGQPYFAVQVEVLAEQASGDALRLLKPGLAAEVYIRTSERTALGFLMEPLTAGLRRSFRAH